MQFALEWTFALVLGFPGTITVALWAAHLSRSWTEGASRGKSRKIRAVAYLASGVAITFCLASFALWSSGFDPSDETMSASVDRALWVGQGVTAAGLLFAIGAAVSARLVQRRTTASH
jgi:hypothetical protein